MTTTQESDTLSLASSMDGGDRWEGNKGLKMLGCEQLVYIAGPMTNGSGTSYDLSAIQEAIRLHGQLVSERWASFCPQLSVLVPLVYPGTIPYEAWLHLDQVILPRCDAVIRIPGESKGADREVKLARQLGMPVYTPAEFFKVKGLLC